MMESILTFVASKNITLLGKELLTLTGNGECDQLLIGGVGDLVDGDGVPGVHAHPDKPLLLHPRQVPLQLARWSPVLTMKVG